MGAPFWSNEEKGYFLQQVVPRSHYATGTYDSSGRSFDDLAVVMQRDLDERGLSRRTYNGDLLFQHWYQKVKPTMNNPGSSPAQGLGPLSANENNAAAGGAAGAEDQGLSRDGDNEDAHMTDTSDRLGVNSQEPTKASPASVGDAPFDEDPDETIDLNINSSPARSRSASALPIIPTSMGTRTNAEATSDHQIRVPQPPPHGTGFKRALKEGSDKDEASAPAKKAKKGRKSTRRIVSDTESEDDGDAKDRAVPFNTPGGATNATKRQPLPHSAEPAPAATHSGLHLKRFTPLPAYVEDDVTADNNVDPFRLPRPVPIPGRSSTPAAAPRGRGRGAANQAGRTAVRDGHGATVTITAATPIQTLAYRAGEPVPPIQGELHDEECIRHLTTGGSMPVAGEDHHLARFPRLGPSPNDRYGDIQPPHPPRMRVDPITHQRQGVVTLQSSTWMTYCPSCRRPF